MKIDKNVRFLVDKELDKGKTTKELKAYKIDAKLRLRIKYKEAENINNSIVNFNVGYRVEIEKWIADAQRCKSGTTHGKKKISATEINNEIQRLEEIAENIFKKYEVANRVPSIDDFRNAFNLACGKVTASKAKAEPTFFDYFDQFTQEEGELNNWTISTYKKYKTVKNHLSRFDKKLHFNKLDEKKLADYISFLRTKKDMRNTTIEKQLKFLKAFLRWTIRKKYNNNTIFETFKPKLKTAEKKVTFLTWNELMILYKFEVPEEKQYLARVRDVFCFLCFTSLRYSDVQNLKRSDVKENHIEVTTIKTTDNLIIDLNDYSRAILERYKDIPFENDKVLPVISNQNMNDYLKELGKLANLNEPVRTTYYKGNERINEVCPKHELLSTHFGRRTFISNAITMGIAPQTVMKWSGHSDYKAMKPYIDVADKDRQDAMKVWDDKEKTDNKNASELLKQLELLPKEQLTALLNQIKQQ